MADTQTRQAVESIVSPDKDTSALASLRRAEPVLAEFANAVRDGGSMKYQDVQAAHKWVKDAIKQLEQHGPRILEAFAQPS